MKRTIRVCSCEFVDRLLPWLTDDPRNHTKYHEVRPSMRNLKFALRSRFLNLDRS